MRDTQFWRRNAVAISTRTSSHKAFSRARLPGLETAVAFLPLRGVGARLDRDRDGFFVFFVGVVLLRVAPAVDSFTDLLVAAAPVVMLARGITISCVTAYASRRVGGQWGGGGGASCEDHLAFCGELLGLRGGLTRLEKPDFNSPKTRGATRTLSGSYAVVDAAIDMIRRIER